MSAGGHTTVLIAPWSPTPQVVVDVGMKQAPCTQVKTPAGLKAFIYDLLECAEEVWPEGKAQ